MKRVWLILAAFFGLAVSALPASAAVVYTLNCSNSTCSSTSTTYGTVTLTQIGSGSTAKVNIAVSLASGFRFAGNNTHSLLFNIPGGDQLTVSNQTSNASSFGIDNSGNDADYAASPFSTTFLGFCVSGCFDYAYDRANGMGSPTALSFDVTRSGGLVLADFTDNDGGDYFFASRIHRNSNNTDLYVAARGIPEPGTMGVSLMVVASLAGLVMLHRRRQLARA